MYENRAPQERISNFRVRKTNVKMAYRIPNLNGLRAFEAAARNLSFSKAAEELNVTPAAVSHQVRGLEDELGVKLFHRKNRAIALSEAGARCFPGVRDGFETIDRAVRTVGHKTGDHVLVISVGPMFTAKWLAPRLVAFMERHPDIDTRISANLNYSDFASDGVDVAIRFGHGNYRGLHVEPLMEEWIVPLCAPRLMASDPPLAKPSDLAAHALIHDESLAFSPEAPNWDDWLKAAGVSNLETGRRGLRFSNADHAISAAVEGAGVVLGRSVIAADDVRSGRLVAPFDLPLPVGMSYHLVHPSGAERRPKIRAFRDWLLDETEDFRQAPDWCSDGT